MSGNTISIRCERCGESANGLPIRIVFSVGRKFQKVLCCSCKYFVHVEMDE